MDFGDDHPREECAVFGVFGHPEAANLTYLGLYALQHRGQESSGIVASDGERVHAEVGMGLVADIFTDTRISTLHGHIAIGHYSSWVYFYVGNFTKHYLSQPRLCHERDRRESFHDES